MWRRLFTNQFTKDFFWSALFLLVVYAITHNPVVRPTPNALLGKWSIQLMQHPLLFGFAGHNYLVVRDGKGNIVYELHGLATDSFTGGWKYVGTKGTDLLKVWEFDNTRYLAEKKFPGVLLVQGAKEDMMDLWENARLCKSAVNEKNLPYPPYGISFLNETINSNSVAYTLSQCMGINPDHIGIWTPGSTMDLLQ